jgi:hypothetical protein
MRIGAALIVLYRGVVVVMPCVLRMAVIVGAGILVMPERHALPRHDRRQALGRDG